MSRKIVITTIALMLSFFGAFLQAQRDQTIPASVGDLLKVQLVEIRDGAGEVLLNGTFVTQKNTDKDAEREAELKSPSGQAAKGKVDVDIERKNGIVVKDEFEIEVEKLPSMTSLSLLIDGQTVTSFTTNKSGKAEFKMTRKTN